MFRKTTLRWLLLFHWRGVRFLQSLAVQLQQVTIGKDLTFDLYDQGVSTGNTKPPFGESAEKIDLNELAFSPRFNNSRRDFLTEFIVG